MQNQCYSARLLKIYGPGLQEFSEMLCRHCTASTRVLPCSFLKELGGKLSLKVKFSSSAGSVTFFIAPGL